MKFTLISDLHWDFWPDNPASAFGIDWTRFRNQIVVLAGDISNWPSHWRVVLDRLAPVARHVVIVDGNHDHYSHKFPVYQGMAMLRRICAEYPNVTFLDGDSHFISDGTAFVGANGWYDFRMSHYSEQVCRNVWQSNMNDVRIDFSDHDGDPARYAAEQSAAIMATMEVLQHDPSVERFVVVTHTVPHPNGLMVRNDPIWDGLNGAFGCVATGQIWQRPWAKPVVAWCFGHTHFANDFDYDGIRFVCNPRGYPGERIFRQGYKGVVIDTDEEVSAFGARQ